jgi:hypothetical protein
MKKLENGVIKMKILITEEKLQTVVDNYRTTDRNALAKSIGVRVNNLNQWVGRFRKNLKNKGISEETIHKYFPRQGAIQNMNPVIDRLMDELVKKG